MMKFEPKELQQIENHGLSVEKVLQNIQTFQCGIPFTKLVAPATLRKGIRKLSENELGFYAEKYTNQNCNVVKFVPASGAATRMFKELQGFEKFENGNGSLNPFFDNLPNFAFYEELMTATKNIFPNFDRFSEEEKKHCLLNTFLDEDKLNYTKLPKGLVPFHKYEQENRTAFEEHFVEACTYSVKNNFGILHFTVTEIHLEKFQKKSMDILKKMLVQAETDFTISYSFQQKSTDTLAVDMENQPFRDENGNLIFRPSGHGALLENLNAIDVDLVFVKNIDNVSTENNLSVLAAYKKALGGILLEIQEITFRILTELEAHKSNENLEDLGEIKTFLKEKLNIQHEPKSIAELINLLNRPIRVCGMVENSGAPGGGPFWIKDGHENVSLQIVETAQIDMENPNQKSILEQATHFNPVDLVCGLRNYKGEKFNLSEFANPNRGFITQKSANGKSLKALELPGLWNGSMEYWNTVFVEVPEETFNPVKTVFDLLKPAHQTF